MQSTRSFLKIIRSLYSYIYLPIQNSPAGLVDLKARELQGIMDKNLLREINSILISKDAGGSSVERINSKLDSFMDDINGKLKGLDQDYAYKSQQGAKLSENDISEIILKKYFAERPLQKDGKPIDALSSGEQRMAIIDVAYSFLSKSAATKRELVLAVDEPESSLNAMNCMVQFKRLLEISNTYKKQCLISTHWYGLLLSPERATLNHISKDEFERPSLSCFDLSSIQESRRRFPDDLEMKSYFDLVSSMLSILRGESKGWVICEGGSDKNYFEKYLGVGNYNILPVGGASNVIKVYEYLKVAMEDRAEQNLLKGNVLCVIDSDTQRRDVRGVSKNAERMLSILRFQKKGDSVDLVKAGSEGDYSCTVIEDALEAGGFYGAMKKAIDELGSKEEKDVFYKGFGFRVGSEVKAAFVTSGFPFLVLKDVNYQDSRSVLSDFVTRPDVKSLISQYYLNAEPSPNWLSKMKSFLEKDQLP